jgi:energy-coupling factor transporter ATP-binding protein EcfA2
MIYKCIALTGKKGEGKNTVAKIITEILNTSNIQTKELSFASPIKDFTCKVFDISHEELENTKNYIPERRRLMQHFGTFVKNNCNEDFWINKLLESINSINNAVPIITDLRFLNEFNKLPKGTFTIRVKRDTIIDNESNHISEKEIDLIKSDEIIENNGNIQELYTEVLRIILKIQT